MPETYGGHLMSEAEIEQEAARNPHFSAEDARRYNRELQELRQRWASMRACEGMSEEHIRSEAFRAAHPSLSDEDIDSAVSRNTWRAAHPGQNIFARENRMPPLVEERVYGKQEEELLAGLKSYSHGLTESLGADEADRFQGEVVESYHRVKDKPSGLKRLGENVAWLRHQFILCLGLENDAIAVKKFKAKIHSRWIELLAEEEPVARLKKMLEILLFEGQISPTAEEAIVQYYQHRLKEVGEGEALDDSVKELTGLQEQIELVIRIKQGLPQEEIIRLINKKVEDWAALLLYRSSESFIM